LRRHDSSWHVLMPFTPIVCFYWGELTALPLTRVDLGGFIHVTDDGVKSLAAMRQTLVWLSLANTRITDAGLVFVARTTLPQRMRQSERAVAEDIVRRLMRANRSQS